MSSKNSSKGASKLASVLQGRMNKVSNRSAIVASEMGVILDGKKLKVDSLPDDVLMPDDYSVGSNIYCLNHYDCVHLYPEGCPAKEKECPDSCLKNGLHKGDRVLVIWTNDGEPIIVDKIV